MMDKSSKNIDSSHILYIDGLRAIAVLAVVIYHLNSTWLPGGFTGVDIFFTISGFIVSFSIAKRRGLNPASFVASFYARRILRIVPALLTCLILVSFAEVLFIPSSWLSDGIEVTAKQAFFGLSNLTLMHSINGYFGPRAEFNPFTHTWSLGIEEQFYLVFPALFYWWTITDKSSRFKYISTSIFTIFFASSIVCAWWLSRADPTLAFYSIFTRFWELAAGVILYQVTADRYNDSETYSGIKWSIGVYISLGLVISGFVFARPVPFPFPWALLPVLGTMGLLVSLRGTKNNLILSGLSSQVVSFIGRISYSLYLWHWPVFVLFRWTVGLDSISSYVIALFLAFFLAIASYYFVEQPVRYSYRIRHLSRAKIIFAGLTIIAVAYSIERQIFIHKAQLSLSVVSKEEELWHDIETLNKSSKCFLVESGRPTEAVQVALFSRPNCQEKRTSQLFVAGDSHAIAYLSMLKRLTMETGTNVHVYAKPGCPYIGLFAPLDMVSSDCQLFYRSTTTDILNHAQRGDIVFLPSLRLRRFTEQWMLSSEKIAREEMFGKAALSKRASATEEASTLLKSFAQQGIKVVFEAPPPIFRSPSFRCSDWFNRMNPICESGLEIQKDMLINYRLPVIRSIRKLLKHDSNINLWDPFPLLCPGSFCRASMDTKLLFIDGDHLSSYGNMLVYPDFEILIKGLMQDTQSKGRSSKTDGGKNLFLRAGQ